MTGQSMFRGLLLAGVVGAGSLAGLGAPAIAATEKAPAFAPVEFPTPPGKSTINRDKTIVVGSATQWFGTLAVDSDANLNEAHQFYSGVMASQGWQPLSAFIAERVVLQFVDRTKGRTAMISIDKRGALNSGTHIDVVISPLIQGAI